MPHSPKFYEYPRRILVAVAAKSPQIVTETLYALACRQPANWLPTEIHIITTGSACELLTTQLTAVGDNWLGQLCVEYELPLALLANTHIHSIKDKNGHILADVRSSADNAIAADFITQLVRELTADLNSSLFASIAGGRRTMTYYLGNAVSLFARPQDCLSHVLVDDQYFFNNAFFYPPRQTKWIKDQHNNAVDASTIQVTLAELPFVRLRDTLPPSMLSGHQSLTETIAAAQARFTPSRLVFNSQTKTLHCQAIQIRLAPLELALYVWLIQRCLKQQSPVDPKINEDPCLSRQFLDIYKRLHGASGNLERIKKALHAGISNEWLSEHRSKINKKLLYTLSSSAEPYLIQAIGKRPYTQYGLKLDPQFIHCQ